MFKLINMETKLKVIDGTLKRCITISLLEYVELLESEVRLLKIEKEKDSSWNYDIEGKEEIIKELKTMKQLR